MTLRDLWVEGKVSLVAECKGERILVTKGKLSKLDKGLIESLKIGETLEYKTDNKEDREFARELFKKLDESGYKAKNIEYYTSRNLFRPKGEYRHKDF
jgi:hypothetical protein